MNGKLTKDELYGGTISISNIGTIGGTYLGIRNMMIKRSFDITTISLYRGVRSSHS